MGVPSSAEKYNVHSSSINGLSCEVALNEPVTFRNRADLDDAIAICRTDRLCCAPGDITGIVRMDDTKHPNDFPPLTIEQIQGLAEAIRDVFGGNLSRKDFADKLLMFLEDVPGYESGEVSASLIGPVWAAYTSHRLGS